MRPDVTSTGSLALDMALQIGGWPNGAIIEVYGDPSTGKSTLGMMAAREAQESGSTAAIIDADRTLDTRYAAALGLDVPALLLCRPATGETAIGIATTLLRSGAVACIVIDSIAALVPEAEDGASIGSASASAHRRLVDAAARDLRDLAHAQRAIVLLVNRPVQARGRDGWVERTAGGTWLPSVASVRVRLERVGSAQIRIRATVEKNVVVTQGANPRAADLVFRWGSGLDLGADLLVAAYDVGVVTAMRSAFYVRGVCLGNLREACAALGGYPWGAHVRNAVLAVAPWRSSALPPLPDDAALSA